MSRNIGFQRMETVTLIASEPEAKQRSLLMIRLAKMSDLEIIQTCFYEQ